MKPVILNLARPTFGDSSYMERWKDVGEAYFRQVPEGVCPNVLVVDQYTTVTNKLLANYPSLRVICTPNTGHTHLQFMKNIPVLSLKGETEFLSTITGVAEFSAYLLLKITKEGRWMLTKSAVLNMLKLWNESLPLRCGT